MNMTRQLLLALALLATAGGLTAQRLVPLEYNAALPRLDQPAPGDPAPAGLPKVDCPPPQPTDFVVVAGTEEVILPDLDTIGLGGAGAGYICLGCDATNFGTAGVVDGRIRYAAGAAVVEGLDTIRAAYCNGLGSCTDTIRVTILARRAGRDFFPAPYFIGPETSIEVNALLGAELPGGATCRFFSECPDNYAGRDPFFYFTDNDPDDIDFFYRASRFPGVDSLCVTVCSELGTCDTYHFAFQIDQPSRSLPFFDDFSYAGPYTDGNLWLDREVFVNQTYAIDPPSLGAATFDGIDASGQPYPYTEGEIRPRDYLTSVPLNLTTGGEPVLTFYLQPRGLGNRPELSDSIEVQFRIQDGRWRTVWSRPGLTSAEGDNSDRPFVGVRLPVPSSFRYDGFQFRFVNYSDETGALDNWNLDYVRLSDIYTELVLQDLAFVQPPPFALRTYTALPYRHLRAGGVDLLNTDQPVLLRNNFTSELAPSTSTFSYGAIQPAVPLIDVALLQGIDADIPGDSLVRRRYDLSLDSPFSLEFPAAVDVLLNDPRFETDEPVLLRTAYELTLANQNTDPGIAASVLRNDRTERITVLDNYFAYDDGTAELGLEALPGQTVVQAYQAFEADELQGVSIRFPRNTRNFSNQDIEIVIYVGELSGDPDYRFTINPLFVENLADTLQAFTTYPLPEALPIPAGNFFVGWKQISNCMICTSVGFDRNNPLENLQFFNNGGNWNILNFSIKGALMIRPIVGDEPPVFSSVGEAPEAELDVLLFPNPVRDRLFVRLPGGEAVANLEYELFDVQGRRLRGGALIDPVIDTSNLPAGVYWLLLADSDRGRVARKKVVIAR
jgi:hypothetical protein